MGEIAPNALGGVEPLASYFESVNATADYLTARISGFEHADSLQHFDFRMHLNSLTFMVKKLRERHAAELSLISSEPQKADPRVLGNAINLWRELSGTVGMNLGPLDLSLIVQRHLGLPMAKSPGEVSAPLTTGHSPPKTKQPSGGTMLGPGTASSLDSTFGFRAHPRLAVDRPLVAKKEFVIVVGFSDIPDAGADFTTPIDIADAKPGETMEVLVSVNGATLRDAWKVDLPLDIKGERTLRATVLADARVVKFAASYVLRHRLVGTIAKTIVVGNAVKTPEPTAHGRVPEWLPALSDEGTIAGIDILLIVQSQGPNLLEWKAYVFASGMTVGPFNVAVQDTTAFAKKLAGIAALGSGQNDDGLLDVIDVGQTIASLVPKELVAKVLTPAFAADRPPTVLLFTDEAFIPWELARLTAAEAARPKAAFLGEVACMGRWWLSATSSGPASATQVRRMSAVAASTYADSQGTLLHAIAERKLLVAKYKAEKVEARKQPMEEWLESPARAGHLAHIALHGYSNPAAQEEGLILGDGTTLTPIRLSGEWQLGETPRFSVVFLNACQVGTAGSRLGQMSGFPGVLIRNGVGAFIAPLWEVNDAVASKVAEKLYERVLERDVTMGEALRAMRAAPRIDNSTTPLAYIYYGHPALRLMRARTTR